MFFVIFTKHKYVIQIYNHEFVQMLTQYFMHQPLERCWRITQAEGHHYEFVETPTTRECCFKLISILYFHLMVATLQVNQRKYTSATQRI